MGDQVTLMAEEWKDFPRLAGRDLVNGCGFSPPLRGLPILADRFARDRTYSSDAPTLRVLCADYLPALS